MRCSSQAKQTSTAIKREELRFKNKINKYKQVSLKSVLLQKERRLAIKISVYSMPMTAMPAKQPTNFIPSCENLKSTGFGNNIDRTSSPLDVEKPRHKDGGLYMYFEQLYVNGNFSTQISVSPFSLAFFLHPFWKRIFVDKWQGCFMGQISFQSPNHKCKNTEGNIKH